MKKPLPLILGYVFIGCASICNLSPLTAANIANQPSAQTAPQATPQFPSFTAKITRNKVRIRLQPNLDSPVIRELNRNDLVIVVGEEDEFFAVQPPEDMKVYVYRTYVLDGVVEGDRVNVRLEPKTEASVIAQLKSGDRVDGTVSLENNKWLEIAPPSTAKFYVSKDYVEKIGDSSYMGKLQKRRAEVNNLLNDAQQSSEATLEKNYTEINADDIISQYQRIINEYTEFEDQTTKAKEQLVAFKENYTKKKISYFEAKSIELIAAENLQDENSKLSKAVKEQQMRLNQLQKQLEGNPYSYPLVTASSAWMPQEEEIYGQWLEKNPGRSVDEFYDEQMKEAVVLKGVLEPYARNIKNKPGDYVLLNANKLPKAYLYSTHVNLQDYVGKEVTITVTSRPNNNFAFPAYFVLSVQ